MGQQLRIAGVWCVGLGLVWAAIASLQAGAFVPAIDPSSGACQSDPDGVCAAGLSRAWWWVGGGCALTVSGVGLVLLSVDRAQAVAPARRFPGVVHALAAALVSSVLFVLAAVCALLPLFLVGAPHVLAPLALVLWLGEAAWLGALDSAVGDDGPSDRWRYAGALVVAAAAVGVGLVDQAREPWQVDVWDVVRHAVTAGLGVLFLRVVTAPGATSARLTGAAAGAAAVLALGALVLVPDPTERLDRRADPDERRSHVPSPTPAATPVPVPVPVPAPVSTPTPEPVVADAPCAQQDLGFAVGGFDGAMGLRAAALVATNTGSSACWLEGVPVVVLLQGGRPLALQVGEGQTPEGGVPQAQRVGVAPGGTASALLTWRTYGGWADAETPQVVTVALDATTTLVPAALPAGEGPAPFDLADGGAWGIAPWATPTS